MKICHLENIDLCTIDSYKRRQSFAETKNLEKIVITISIFYIKFITCKGIHSTVQAEIHNINSLYFSDLKVLGTYSGLNDMFVYYYDVEARCAFSLF